MLLGLAYEQNNTLYESYICKVYVTHLLICLDMNYIGMNKVDEVKCSSFSKPLASVGCSTPLLMFFFLLYAF
jgi:hypothetical protein